MKANILQINQSANSRLLNAHTRTTQCPLRCTNRHLARDVPEINAHFIGSLMQAPQMLGRPSSVLCQVGRRVESEDEAIERRMKESAAVEDRTKITETYAQIKREVQAADPNKLVILEVQGENVCETGLDEEPEFQWKDDAKLVEARKMEECGRIRSTFQRTARECPNTIFLEADVVPDSPEGIEIMQKLDVTVLPTIIFFRNGYRLWEQVGSQGMAQELGEGVLFCSNEAANGVRGDTYVRTLKSVQDHWAFVDDDARPDVLKVVMVGTTCKPCIKAYPALLALARSFSESERKITDFGRFLVDEDQEYKPELRALGIVEVPTFIFYRDGKETGRLVSSSRGDLIGTILQQLSDAGISPPPPPPNPNRGSRRTARTV